MKNKKVQLVLILIGLLIFTVLFSLLSNHIKRSNYDNETTKNHKKVTTNNNIETTSNKDRPVVSEEFENPINVKISNITPELRKTVKDFSEIEDKVYEVVNSFYPDTKKIKYKEFKQDSDKYSYYFDLSGELNHELIVYYWLKDKTLSYQHY